MLSKHTENKQGPSAGLLSVHGVCNLLTSPPDSGEFTGKTAEELLRAGDASLLGGSVVEARGFARHDDDAVELAS